MNSSREHLQKLRVLVLLPCHAIYTGKNSEHPCCADAWELDDFQKGEQKYYIAHIRSAVDRANSLDTSLLIFSGGQTRLKAGPLSEAQSYWFLSDHFSWWASPGVRARAVTEEFARDSYENLLFSICRFKEFVGRYPERIQIFGWKFKEQRFDLHRQTIRWLRLPEAYQYVRVNDPSPADLAAALAGENRTIAAFKKDPFGVRGVLAAKRIQRNPFRRQHPYQTSCVELRGLLNSTGTAYQDSLPW